MSEKGFLPLEVKLKLDRKHREICPRLWACFSPNEVSKYCAIQDTRLSILTHHPVMWLAWNVE